MKLAAQSAIYGARTLPEILALASSSGFAGVELFPGQLEPYFADPAELRRLLAHARLELTAVFVPFRLVWGEALAANSTRLDQICRVATAAGCALIEWGGGLPLDQLPPSPSVWSEVVATYHRAADLAARHGLRSVFHPQTDHTVSTPAHVASLASHGLDFQRIGLCPDSWQIRRAGADPLAVFADFAPRIGHYHLADCTRDGLKPAPFGHGAVALPALIDQIFATGYDGWIVLDSLAAEEDPVQGGRSAAEFISSRWRELIATHAHSPASATPAS